MTVRGPRFANGPSENSFVSLIEEFVMKKVFVAPTLTAEASLTAITLTSF
jgi:hypothetical protein